MVTYVSKFIPNYSDVVKNLRALLKQNVEFIWSEIHDKEFINLKQMLTKTPVLKFYDQKKTCGALC